METKKTLPAIANEQKKEEIESSLTPELKIKLRQFYKPYNALLMEYYWTKSRRRRYMGLERERERATVL